MIAGHTIKDNEWVPIHDPFYIDSMMGAGYTARLAANLPKIPRRPKDLTPRQIEWCRENLFNRKEKVAT
jgi:hypothetical protein